MAGEAIQLGPGPSLLAGPLVVSDGSSFPGSTSNVPLALLPPVKPYAACSGVLGYTLNSPNGFVQLGAVGANGPVTQAQTIYARSQTQVILRLTYQGDATTYLIYLFGLIILEADPSHPITKIEAQGSGLIEVLAAGLI